MSKALDLRFICMSRRSSIDPCSRKRSFASCSFTCERKRVSVGQRERDCVCVREREAQCVCARVEGRGDSWARRRGEQREREGEDYLIVSSCCLTRKRDREKGGKRVRKREEYCVCVRERQSVCV